MYDLIIKDGLIIDGTGRQGFYGDIAVTKDRIVKIGDLKDNSAEEIIDAGGKVVAPGFIDIHSHSDGQLFTTLDTDNVIRQGVTTEVVGQCGDSPYPMVTKLAQEKYEFPAEGKWTTAADFFNKVEDRGLTHNIVPLMGHGAIRFNVLGYDGRDATPEEITQMQELVEEGMQNGAYGISWGPYPPALYANTHEVMEVCKVVAKYNGVFSIHLRSQSAYLLESVDEAIEIARQTGVKVDISHLKAANTANWGKVVAALEKIKDARKQGLDIICDVYPYTAASNPLSSEFPGWVQEGGREKLLARLQDPTLREKIMAEMPADGGELWDQIFICGVKSQDSKQYLGKNIKDIAKERGMSSFDIACDLLIENSGSVHAIVACMDEEDVKHVLASDIAAVGADGGVAPTDSYTGHPRAFGTFPAFIGRYVRDMGLVSLEEGIRKITSLPAQFIGIKDRGVIQEDNYADLVVFDYSTIIDKASYDQPAEYPEGIHYVLVNGEIQFGQDSFNKKAPGRILKNM